MIAQYAVFGNPIAHSRSPQIHRLFATQEGANISYRRILADRQRNAFADAVRGFFASGAGGANITVPFKEYAFDLADEHSEQAQASGAVNTLIPLPNGGLRGDNTDGAGLVCDLQTHLQTSLRGKRLLLLGAGGAARGAVCALLDTGLAELVVANRSADKAQVLARRFGIAATGFHALPPNYFDVVVNATSAGLNGEVPDICPAVFGQCVLGYDMLYASDKTAFMRFAAASGATATADGLGMLVRQAAESYRLWRGFTPDADAVITALRRRPRKEGL
ncbi:shikimate dehydrogenase [Conchiformibius kuhniae]|uniref:Shikimate dehydrogenase (NADP(+)) n=1 Tax=Conchiformibius kuhniae TaxID=211502 RepID=A0A8T9MWB4_9NEIS|nr:shikimate dehydrogenase [Conchiformibius kuhniae]